MSGNSWPWPVARPIASARSAWALAFVEAVEVELGARQMHRGVQTPRELVVAEGVDERGCLGAGGLGLPGWRPTNAAARAYAATAVAVSTGSPSRRAASAARTPQDAIPV